MSYNYPKEGLKLIFSIITGVLMIPLYFKPDINFYRTVFIYQIGVMIELLFSERKSIFLFFDIWDTIHIIFSVLSCSVAFACMVPSFIDFANEQQINTVINDILLAVVWSCLFKSAIEFIFMTIRKKILGEMFENN